MDQTVFCQSSPLTGRRTGTACSRWPSRTWTPTGCRVLAVGLTGKSGPLRLSDTTLTGTTGTHFRSSIRNGLAFHSHGASDCILFSAPIERVQLRKSESVQPYYLGYSVNRPTRPNCIGRTLIAPEGRVSAIGTMRLCAESPSIQGTELRVEGFPFISQDSDVTVCAQAALWMLARYFSNRYPIYPESYPVQIGNLTHDYSVGRMYPTAGLYVWQLAEALRRLDFAPLLYARSQYDDPTATTCHTDHFDHLLYTYIESGIPVLAAFRNHVIVLFGHVSDYSDVRNISPAAAGCSFALS